MIVTFLGGVGEYGRSCFLLEVNKQKILIDCGVLKSGRTVQEQYPLLTPELASEVKAVFLTHAHEDHTGALPYLVHLGFTGEVYATAETIKQTRFYLRTWRETQLVSGRKLPYTLEDEVSLSFRTLDEWKGGLIPGLTFDHGRSGHIIGSVWFLFQYNQETVYFSGDFSMESLLLQFDFPASNTVVDFAVMDGAYGMEKHTQHEYCEQIVYKVKQAEKENASIIFPLPPYGRAQDLLFLLKSVFVESSFSIMVDERILEATETYLKAESWFKPDVFTSYKSWMNYLKENKTNERTSPFIAFYSETHLLKNTWWLEDEGNILFVFTGPKNKKLIKKITEKQKGTVSMEELRYKVHPAAYETEKLLHRIKPKHTALTHSLVERSGPLAKEISIRTGLDVGVPV
ncbi:MBL fold metallo-hydrolase [Virgibacillus oceani]